MATIGVFARFAALPAEHITFYRLFLGSLCLLLYMLGSKRHQQIVHRFEKRSIANGMMLAGFMVFYIMAVQYTSMAIAVILIYIAPLLTAGLAHVLFKERLNRLNVLAICVALLGFVLIMPDVKDVEIANSSQWLGFFYGCLAAITYSGFMLINRKPGKANEYQSTLSQLIIGALCLLPFVLMTPQNISVEQAIWLLAIGIIPGFIAILFAVKALRHLPAVTFGTLAYVEPVAVVLFAWLLFGETLNVMQLTGCLFILSAGLFQGFISKRQAIPNSHP